MEWSSFFIINHHHKKFVLTWSRLMQCSDLSLRHLRSVAVGISWQCAHTPTWSARATVRTRIWTWGVRREMLSRNCPDLVPVVPKHFWHPLANYVQELRHDGLCHVMHHGLEIKLICLWGITSYWPYYMYYEWHHMLLQWKDALNVIIIQIWLNHWPLGDLEWNFR